MEWREKVAREKTRRFRECDYWGKPVPGFGDPDARLLVLGLAPAAHGANRTGRVFTGDGDGGSGDFLMAAMHRHGFASIPTSRSINDGLQLRDAFIAAAVRCAPPGNKPTPDEERNCSGYLDREWELLIGKRVILALGGIAWKATLALAARHDCAIAPRFIPTNPPVTSSKFLSAPAPRLSQRE